MGARFMNTEEARKILDDCLEKHKNLLEQVSALGFIAQGSINERYLTCSSKNCSCHSDPSKRHGPYVYWTTKVQGKTVSRILKGETAELMRQWVANRIELDSIVEQLRQLSVKALEPSVLLMQQERESTD
jgi:hypothetical protein